MMDETSGQAGHSTPRARGPGTGAGPVGLRGAGPGPPADRRGVRPAVPDGWRGSSALTRPAGAAVAGIAAFAGLLFAVRSVGTEPGGRASDTAPFSRGFWIVAAAEAAAIAAGTVVFAVILHAPRAIFGWISLVVGVHFFGLAHVWGLRFYGRLGTVITTCGAAGLAAAAAGAGVAVIAVVAAIIPGVLLLAASFLSIRRYRDGRTGGARYRPGFRSRAGRVGR